MIQRQECYRNAEDNYATALLKLAVAKGCSTKLLAKRGV